MDVLDIIKNEVVYGGGIDIWYEDNTNVVIGHHPQHTLGAIININPMISVPKNFKYCFNPETNRGVLLWEEVGELIRFLESSHEKSIWCSAKRYGNA